MPLRLALLGALATSLCAATAAGQEAVGVPGGRLDFQEVVREAKARVFPAVVFIKVLSETHESGRRSARSASGSGVIVSASGEVVTNWHVVERAISVRCQLADGRAMAARVVGSDQATDLALLQLDTDGAELPTATFGDSATLEEGQFVMAMGAPWGLNRSVSIGIVSCARRFLEGASEYSLWLQTDASISPGNSGGPLVDTRGEVVGINTRGTSGGGDLGFAIPAETVRVVLPLLRARGHAGWSWTGLQLQPLRDFERDVYFEGDDGVIVAGADPDSPASAAGLLPRDRLLAVGGEPVRALTVEDLPDLRRRLGLLSVGEEVTLRVRRGGQELELRLTPREKGQVEGQVLDCPRWDLTLKSINRFEHPQLHFYRQEGVLVFALKQPGNAVTTGLRPNDIVVAIDGTEVTTLEQARALHAASLEGLARDHSVVFTVLRGGLRRQFVLDFARDYSKQ